jgi:nicotinamidase-related amidase
MRILPEHAAGLIIDFQERLWPHMHMAGELEKNCQKLISGLSILNIPLVTTEQYPKGLGPTCASISTLIPNFDPIEKMVFSCCHQEKFREVLRNIGKRAIIICGIEAHVCVLQTVIDLVELGYQPVVVEDCVDSRKASDKQTAISRMIRERVIVTSQESILFELCQRAGTERFKKISKLVK